MNLLMVKNVVRRIYRSRKPARQREPRLPQDLDDIRISSNFITFLLTGGQMCAHKTEGSLTKSHTD